MIIEIRRAGFINKGAHLMVLAIIAELRKRYPTAKFTMVADGYSQSFEKMTALGFFPKVSLYRRGIEFGNLVNLVPKKLRNRYGLVIDKEVDVVIDAAGFAYGDKWGKKSTYELGCF